MKIKVLEDLKVPLSMLVVIVILLLAFITYVDMGRMPLNNEDFERATVRARGNELYLTSGCDRLTMLVTAEQSTSIQEGLENYIGRRPDTHDLMKDVLMGYGIGVLQARIYVLEESSYKATLYLKKGDKILELDSRPSDAIAIALRTNSPIYVKSSLLEKYGEKVC